MKKITDSAIFNQVVKNAKVMNSIGNINVQRDMVTFDKIEEPLQVIRKRMNFPTKVKSLNYLETGKVILIDNPEYSLPKYLNTLGRVHNGNLVAVVDISQFARFSSTTNSYDVFPKTLFSLIQNGTILLELINNWNRFNNNINLIKYGSITYAKLVAKVMDKLFAISINNFKQDTVMFFLAKFFLINMCDKAPSETIDNIAHSACLNRSSLQMIKEEESSFTEDAYDDIFKLFENMKNIKGLNSLNVRSFIENWARMYGEASLLALDYLPCFYSMIFSSIVNGNINKDFIIENAAGKFVGQVYTEFSRLVG